MPVEKISISLYPDVAAQVVARGEERSTQINRMLRRYAGLMKRERIELRKLLSDNEIGLILDACNGTMFMDEFSIGLVGAGVADAIEVDGLDRKWRVDGAVLNGKLGDLSLIARFALVDAVQAWWNRVGNGEQPPFAEALEWPSVGGLEAPDW